MGCNYYLKAKDPCHCCGRPFEDLHIGKSSVGWYFSLHIIPEMGIYSLDDWRNLWSAPGAVILDESGNRISVSDMEMIITVRHGNQARGTGHYASESQMHRLNNSEWGDNNLLRCKWDSKCAGHGEGPWSYFTGDFS